jgi:hypothetical protein
MLSSQVSLYNMVPEGLSMLHRLKEAERLLHPGVKIAIIEPFYKLMLDGTTGVRVDHARDVRHISTHV